MSVTSIKKTAYVSDADTMPKPNIQTVEFDHNGNPIHVGNNSSVFARSVTNFDREIARYYVMEYDGSLFDPIGANGFRVKHLDVKLTQVPKQVFDYYMMYLKTNSSVHLTRAQRDFING